jgi:hypothetical protein
MRPIDIYDNELAAMHEQVRARAGVRQAAAAEARPTDKDVT